MKWKYGEDEHGNQLDINGIAWPNTWWPRNSLYELVEEEARAQGNTNEFIEEWQYHKYLTEAYDQQK